MKQDMELFCNDMKKLINEGRYRECESNIVGMIEKYPHSAVPHNLLGILLEKENNHILAMKHFRAAYALDPTYMPSRYNMEQYGSFYKTFRYAYTEKDCKERRKGIFN